VRYHSNSVSCCLGYSNWMLSSVFNRFALHGVCKQEQPRLTSGFTPNTMPGRTRLGILCTSLTTSYLRRIHEFYAPHGLSTNFFVPQWTDQPNESPNASGTSCSRIVHRSVNAAWILHGLYARFESTERGLDLPCCVPSKHKFRLMSS
jgi:hypothetical protein